MDEREWLASTDPERMLNFLRASASDRKLRLFAAACCRQVWRYLDPPAHDAIEVGERYADGEATEEERSFSHWAFNGPHSDCVSLAHLGCVSPRDAQVWEAVVRTSGDVLETAGMYDDPEADRDGTSQAALLRCIYATPFRPLPPRSFPAHVLGLAGACYAAFPAVSDQLPILADALEELGEERAAAHCREQVHAKGCHVVDWILGKD